MARIDLELPNTWFNRFARWYSRRTYGQVLQPGLAAGHNPRVLVTYVAFESAVAKWTALDKDLKNLAVMAAAQRIGCAWCADYGYWAAQAEGTSEAKLREIPCWRESTRFTDLERKAMAYAESMSGETDEVTDEMVTELIGLLGEKAMVELTMMIAVENQRSRFNSALGLTSQGFRESCEMRR